MKDRFRQFVNHRGTRRDIADLLQATFLAEFISPSDRLWIVSPWISDIEVVNNQANTLTAILPGDMPPVLRLSDALSGLVGLGTEVLVVTRKGHSDTFALGLASKARNFEKRLRIVTQAELHSKGIVGDDYCLTGSMNLTHSGLSSLDEILTFHKDPEEVAARRLEFEHLYGGLSR